MNNKGFENSFNNLSEKNRELENKIKKTAESLSLEEMAAFAQALDDKAEYLRSKYPDCEQRAVFQVLIRSGVSHQPNLSLIQEDFPGDDSVARFIDDLIEKYSI